MFHKSIGFGGSDRQASELRQDGSSGHRVSHDIHISKCRASLTYAHSLNDVLCRSLV